MTAAPSPPRGAPTFAAEAAALASAEFAAGRRRVRLDMPTGTGSGIAAALAAAEASRHGRVVLLCPRMLHPQAIADMGRFAPDVSVGRAGEDASVLVIDPSGLRRAGAERIPGAVATVVVGEFHPDGLARYRQAVDRFPGARVLDVRTYPDQPGTVEPETVITLGGGVPEAGSPGAALPGP